MAQYIEVGQDVIEFPDTMSDDDIAKVLGGGARTLAGAQQEFQQMGPAGQAVSVAAGVPEAAVQMGTIPLAAIAGGAAGLSAMAQGQPGATDIVSKVMEDYTYQPRSAGGQILTEEYLGPAYEKVKHGVGMAAGYGVQADQALGIDFTKPLNQPKPSTPFSEEARSAAEFTFDAALLGGPVRGIGKGVKARRVADERAKHENLLKEAAETEARLSAEQNQAFRQARQQELEGFTELTKEAEPRTPYNMPESLRRQLEAELNPPVEQRQVGQGELFSEKPMGVVERPVRDPSKPLEYTPEEPSITPEGRMAQAQGMEATRPGATEPLRMGALEYPQRETKPRLMGPQAVSREVPTPAGKPRIRSFRQGGVIDKDLLTFGTAGLLEKYAGDAQRVLEKFRGTFTPDAISTAIRKATSDPKTWNLVWMKPDDFHKLARERPDISRPEILDKMSLAQATRYRENLRSSIRRGLKTFEGLLDIPELDLHKNPEGQWQIRGHEGRHRMDVFKEQGMDLIPVRVKKLANGDWPQRVQQEYGMEVLDFPDPIFKGDLDFTGTGKSGFRQGGAIDPRILPEALKQLRKLAGKIPGILKNYKGEAVIVFRGSHGGFYDPRMPRTKESAEAANTAPIYSNRYAVFTTDNPYLAGDFAVPISEKAKSSFPLERPGANIVPFVLKPKKLIKYEGHYNPFKFDALARQLGSGEVLVARNMRDWGPNSGWDYPLNRDKAKSDQYAFTDPEVAIPLYEALGKQTNPNAGKFGQGGAFTPFASSKPSLGDIKKELKAKGINLPDEAVKALYEKHYENQAPKDVPAHPKSKQIGAISKIDGLKQIQRQYADLRTIDEIKPEIAAMKADTLATMAGRNTIDKIVQGRFIAKGNPLLSWVSSNIHWKLMGAIEKFYEKAHGKNGSRLKPEEGSFTYQWRQLSRKSQEAVNEVGWALQNSEAWLGNEGIQAKAREVIGRELTPYEMTAYTDRNRIMKEVLKDVNKALIEEGKTPIHELPHYWSPAVFDGPFKVLFKDKKTGETVKVHAAYLKPDINKLKKEFGKDYELVEVPDSGLRGNVDWNQFEWILRQLSAEMRNPAAKAINEGLRRMGFQARGLKRKGVEGAAGSEGGKKGLKRYEEMSERYIRDAYNFLAKRELDKISNQVKELNEANHIPYTKGYALEALEAARGHGAADFEKFGARVASIISGAITFGTRGKINLPQRFTRDFLRHGNKIKTTLLLGLGNFIHIGAQLLQAPTFMPPKMLAMAAESGINPVRIFDAMHRATNSYMKWDKTVDAQKLKQVGAFEPTFKYDWSTYAADSNPHFKQTMVDHLTGVSTLSWIEAQAVRRPAAHMFLEMLREIGYDKIAKDKMEIYRVAREMTDQYMVSTRFHEKPHVFSRTGLVGMAISPLQSFATTWLGMLREYWSLAARGALEGSAAKSIPLGAFLGTSLLTTGMLGFVGVREWDALADLLNKAFGYNIPSGTEYIMSKTKSDAVRFGALTEALGWNVGATFGAPSLTGSLAPGVQFWAGVGKLASNFAKETGAFGESNKPTDVQWRDSWKSVMPRFSPLDVISDALGLNLPPTGWGAIERKYTPENAPYQEASGQAGPVMRTPKDWEARKWGTYTTEEAKTKTSWYAANRRQSKLGKHVDRAVDELLRPTVNRQAVETLMGELREKKFTQEEVRQALLKEIRRRMTPADRRGIGRAQSPKQQRLYLLYQRMGGLENLNEKSGD